MSGNNDLVPQHPPTCNLRNAYDIEDEQHVLFHCTHLHVVSHHRTFASLFHPTGFHDMSTFLAITTTTTYISLHDFL